MNSETYASLPSELLNKYLRLGTLAVNEDVPDGLILYAPRGSKKPRLYTQGEMDRLALENPQNRRQRRLVARGRVTRMRLKLK